MSGFLDGKVALVTGAASGIGRATALAFATEGAAVALIDIVDTSSVAAQIAEGGGRCFEACIDVTNEDSVCTGIGEVDVALGGIDISVACAGIADDRPLLETSLEDWNRVLRVNLSGVFLTGREVIRVMTNRSRGGRVISISSDHGFMGWEERSAYCASKSGVLALTRCWAREFGPQIHVNSICPGPVETPLLMEGITPELMARETDIPLRRVGRPEEVAAVALALAGPAGDFTTGQAWGVNGGSVMP
jgi:3-oxoacyl-[acyl-carrier protein] reductase